ncbi:hypothetical protein ACFYY1_28850 [Streptomyces sp. NPDC001890]|uniref:hypothetical protein n=1 Tax=Streptomyces sp. NPDC001890 TaxID=3364620 RepID=UPI0036A67D2F
MAIRWTGSASAAARSRPPATARRPSIIGGTNSVVVTLRGGRGPQRRPGLPAPPRPGGWRSPFLDHTTATALHEPENPHTEAIAAFYVQASGGPGTLCVPALALTTDDTERPGLLARIHRLRFITIEPFDAAAELTATGLLHAGRSWAAVHAFHTAHHCADFPVGLPLPARPHARALRGNRRPSRPSHQ